MSDILMDNEMDRLRGENDRLKAERDAYHEDLDMMGEDRDRLKAEVVALNESRGSNLQAVDHLTAELAKVKGELEKVSKFGADEMLRRGDAMAKQLFLIKYRDRWRGIAEGAREALGKAIIMLPCGGPGIHPCVSCDCKDALAAFPPPGPKEPS